jgi:hypothetical protein
METKNKQKNTENKKDEQHRIPPKTGGVRIGFSFSPGTSNI